MYVRKETLLSSQIEGTQASLDDILDPRMEYYDRLIETRRKGNYEAWIFFLRAMIDSAKDTTLFFENVSKKMTSCNYSTL